jgi:hypothetical protein
MKTNAKVVMWSFVAVPCVVALVLAGIGGHKTQAKYELGRVTWSEMAGIAGGGNEAATGCKDWDQDCSGSNSGSCSVCKSWDYWNEQYYFWTGYWLPNIEPPLPSRHDYAMTGKFKAVDQVNGGPPKEKIVLQMQVDCERTVMCVPGFLVYPGHCVASNCQSKPPLDPWFEMYETACRNYSDPTVLPPFSKYNRGHCGDP